VTASSELSENATIVSTIDNTTGITSIVLTNTDLINATTTTPIINVTLKGVSQGNSDLILENVEITYYPDFNVSTVTDVTDGNVNVTGIACTGNIDGTGEVDLKDAIYLAKHVVGLSGYETLSANGNIDGTGEVDLKDAIYLAKHVVGLSGYETLCPIG